MAKRNMISSR